MLTGTSWGGYKSAVISWSLEQCPGSWEECLDGQPSYLYWSSGGKWESCLQKEDRRQGNGTCGLTMRNTMRLYACNRHCSLFLGVLGSGPHRGLDFFQSGMGTLGLRSVCEVRD